jgi:hypothetical protein
MMMESIFFMIGGGLFGAGFFSLSGLVGCPRDRLVQYYKSVADSMSEQHEQNVRMLDMIRLLQTLIARLESLQPINK